MNRARPRVAGALALLLLLLSATGAGCATTATKTVTTSAGATSAGTASAGAATTSNSTAAVPRQVFHGSGQKDLGTITVASDSTISWNCPGCGGTNFIINNAKSDDNPIPTNALDETHGVDPIPAGTYHTVVVDTDGGAWTVAIGETAPAPDSGGADSSGSGGTGSSGSFQAQSGFTQCDANVAARSGTTDCPFAENTFYEYWAHHGASTISVYSPNTGGSFSVHCNSDGDQVDCGTDQGGEVQFSQSSIDAYTSDQAAGYAASHKLGP